MTGPVRYAVVGAGWISQEAFLPAIPQVENSVVTAIVSGSPDRAQKLAAFYDIPNVYAYEDYDAMLAADVVDAVYVALPNSMHADYAIRAMKAGKHALVEKPLAVSIAESEEMITTADAAGVFLMTAYRLHSEPGTVKVLELIRAGEIGEPRHFACTFSFQSGDDNHRLLAKHWGGPLQDIGVYCVNAVRHCFGDEPVSVMAIKSHGNGDARFREVEGSMAVTLAFPGEKLAQFLFSFEADDTDTFRIIGTKGEITVDQCFDFHLTPRVWLSKGRDRVEIDVPDSDHFGGQAAYFSDCILSGTAPVPDGQEGLADMRVLLAIEQAAKTGVTQTIQPVLRDQSPSAETRRIVPRTDRRLVF